MLPSSGSGTSKAGPKRPNWGWVGVWLGVLQDIVLRVWMWDVGNREVVMSSVVWV